jgi:hypothetical protein
VRSLTFLCSLIVTLSAPAYAQSGSAAFQTGNDLLRTCESTSLVDASFCLGFIHGVDVVMSDVGEMLQTPVKTCRPDGVTLGQQRDIVLKSLKDRPQQRHWEAWTLIHNAMMDAFPCPR